MPTLNWLGKDKVIGYHREVMPHALECRWTHGTLPQDVGAKPSMVIHGDNLLALKALLPEYEGKVDVVYIDPCRITRASECLSVENLAA